MSILFASSLLVVLLTLAACFAAIPEQRARPFHYQRVVIVPLLLVAATLIVLYLPPSNDFWDVQVWLMGLAGAAMGIARGSLIGLRVDQEWRGLSLRRAPEGFWIAVVVALLVLADVVAEPIGQVESSFVQTIELVLVTVSSFLVGRNAALWVRTRDAPHHDL